MAKVKRFEAFFSKVLERALFEVRESGIDVYTLALYHDHESAAVSVCADTRVNSSRNLEREQLYQARYFQHFVQEADLASAKLWQTTGDRSYSLGDFEVVNAARTNLRCVSVDQDFYLAMIRTLIAKQGEVLALTTAPQDVRFCCSSADSEVGFVWPRLDLLPEGPPWKSPV